MQSLRLRSRVNLVINGVQAIPRGGILRVTLDHVRRRPRWGRVEEHGGWIDVESKEGVGSLLAVYLRADT